MPKLSRLRILTADGATLTAEQRPPFDSWFQCGNNHLLVAIPGNKASLLRDALQKPCPRFHAEIGGPGLYLRGCQIRFNRAKPRKGDVLAVVRRHCGKIIGVTAPVIRVGNNG